MYSVCSQGHVYINIALTLIMTLSYTYIALTLIMILTLTLMHIYNRFVFFECYAEFSPCALSLYIYSHQSGPGAQRCAYICIHTWLYMLYIHGYTLYTCKHIYMAIHIYIYTRLYMLYMVVPYICIHTRLYMLYMVIPYICIHTRLYIYIYSWLYIYASMHGYACYIW